MIIFQWANHYQFNLEVCPIFLKFSALTVLAFPHLFHTNPHLNSFQITKNININFNRLEDDQIKDKTIKIHTLTLSLQDQRLTLT